MNLKEKIYWYEKLKLCWNDYSQIYNQNSSYLNGLKNEKFQLYLQQTYGIVIILDTQLLDTPSNTTTNTMTIILDYVIGVDKVIVIDKKKKLLFDMKYIYN